MSAEAFLDTNVLIYAFAQGDPRSEAAESLLAEGGVLSVQVLNEFAAVARRKLKMDWVQITEASAALRELCKVVPVDEATHEAALQLASRHSFQFYDALVIAAARQAECTVLYSEDMQHDLIVDKQLRIRNPFLAQQDATT